MLVGVATLHIAHCTLHTAHCTLQIAHFTHCTLLVQSLHQCLCHQRNRAQLCLEDGGQAERRGGARRLQDQDGHCAGVLYNYLLIFLAYGGYAEVGIFPVDLWQVSVFLCYFWLLLANYG